jgi:HEAT repeat protein
MPTRRIIVLLLLAGGSLATQTGCTTIPSWASRWPIIEPDRTTYETPKLRSNAVRAFAERSTGVDSQDQRDLTDQLARQIQIEPDPLVRETIIETIAKFQTPLAQQVLQSGLRDADEHVRITCCQVIGERADPVAVESLATALEHDDSIDVRMAAAEALGEIPSPAAIQALRIALDDRDPAMQLVGVQSLKAISGQDLGGDVSAWRQFAAGETPQVKQPPTSLAERVKQAVHF